MKLQHMACLRVQKTKELPSVVRLPVSLFPPFRHSYARGDADRNWKKEMAGRKAGWQLRRRQ